MSDDRQSPREAAGSRRLPESGIVGVFESTETGGISDANQAFLDMAGYTRDDLAGGLLRWDRMTAPGYEDAVRRLQHQLIDCGISAPAELEYLRKDGSLVPVLMGLASIPGPPDTVRAIGFTFNLTEQKRAMQELKHSEAQFRQLAEHIREVFWIADASAEGAQYVSPAFEEIWGRTCESCYQNPESWLEAVHPADRAAAATVAARQREGEVIENEYRIVQPSGAIRWIRDRAFPIRDTEGHVIRLAGVAEDVTERKLSEIELMHRAQYDELTDLPNRRTFRKELAKATGSCPSKKPGAVFFIDLDRFKFVNDTLGHAEGDQVLKEVAKRLREVADGRGIVARFGGDEFTYFACGFEDIEAIRRMGNRFIARLNEPFLIGDREVFIGASIGVSLFPDDGTDAIALKRNADIAMHDAKRAGKNQLMFYAPAMAQEVADRMELETRMRRALELAEFRLQFQPQFAFGESKPRRFEALIRWHPRDGAPIPPMRFIPLAEESGLIIPIGKWVLFEACRRCAAWQEGNLRGAGVAVNVSALQFACADFVGTVAEALRRTGLAAHLLELELTETVFVSDVKTSSERLEELRRLGITIALDDFGTGYSSLSYLQSLPIDGLKIDRSFLTHAESRPEGASVMRCVVELAHALGIRVVGEGVETVRQLEMLDGLGCDELQGFLLGRPSFDVDAAWRPNPATTERSNADVSPWTEMLMSLERAEAPIEQR